MRHPGLGRAHGPHRHLHPARRGAPHPPVHPAQALLLRAVAAGVRPVAARRHRRPGPRDDARDGQGPADPGRAARARRGPGRAAGRRGRCVRRRCGPGLVGGTPAMTWLRRPRPDLLVPAAVSALVAVVVLGPALGRGVVLAYDLAWSPDPRLTPFTLGTSTPAPRAVPSDAVGVVLGLGARGGPGTGTRALGDPGARRCRVPPGSPGSSPRAWAPRRHPSPRSPRSGTRSCSSGSSWASGPCCSGTPRCPTSSSARSGCGRGGPRCGLRPSAWRRAGWAGPTPSSSVRSPSGACSSPRARGGARSGSRPPRRSGPRPCGRCRP